jgi:hypothetical protein
MLTLTARDKRCAEDLRIWLLERKRAAGVLHVWTSWSRECLFDVLHRVPHGPGIVKIYFHACDVCRAGI